MIRQKQVVTKTDTATLAITEIGDIVANKATALTLSVLAASGYKGLWYHIINIGAGVCTVAEIAGSTLITLIQNESTFVVCNGTTWYTTNNAVEAQKVMLADAGEKITAENVEDALQENRTAIDLNTAKNTNVPTELSLGTIDGTSVAITSDGGEDDVTLPQADTDYAGLLSAAKWDEIVANTLKIISDVAYNEASWNANADASSKNAIRDQIETMLTAIGLNTTHKGSDGSDHDFIDQDVTIGSSPAFTNAELTTPIIYTKQTTIGGVASDAATLGTELVSNGTFDSDLSDWTISAPGTGWEWDATEMALHDDDNVETLSQDVNVTLNEYYVLSYTIVGRTAGTIIPSLNAADGYTKSSDGTYYFSWKATATAAHSLMFTPSANFNGKLDDISFKQVTNGLATLIELKDSSEVVSAEMRSGIASLSNFFIGKDSGKNNYNGYANVAIGYATMRYNTTGYSDAAIGYIAMYYNTTGYDNVAIGSAAMFYNTTGCYNAAIGSAAMHYNTTGYSNAAIGSSALRHNTTGYDNVAIGPEAMRSNTTGYSNAAIGYEAMRSNTIGYVNVAIGYAAMYYSQTGNGNVAIGYQSCGYGTGAVFTSASNHTIIGYQAGYNIGTNDSANVMIGYQAGFNEVGSNKLYISNTNTATPLIYGEFDNGILSFYADVGIGIAPTEKLQISGNIFLTTDSQKILFGTGKDMSIYYNGTNGYIKTDEIAPSDLHITAGAEKTLVLDTVVYRDINAAGYLLTKPVSSAPGTVNFVDKNGVDTGIPTYAFAVGEYVSGGFEIQHDYKEGTDLVFHVHWQGIAAPSGTDNVQWRLTYLIMRDETVLEPAVTIDSPDTVFDTQYDSKRTDFAAIDGSGFLIEDQFVFNL